MGETLEVTSDGLVEVDLVLCAFDAGKLAEQDVNYYTPFSTVSITGVLDVIKDLHQTNSVFGQA